MCQFKGTRVFGCQATETAKVPKIVVQSTRFSNCFANFLHLRCQQNEKYLGQYFCFGCIASVLWCSQAPRLKGVQCWVLSRCFAVTVTVTYWRNRKVSSLRLLLSVAASPVLPLSVSGFSNLSHFDLQRISVLRVCRRKSVKHISCSYKIQNMLRCCCCEIVRTH